MGALKLKGTNDFLCLAITKDFRYRKVKNIWGAEKHFDLRSEGLSWDTNLVLARIKGTSVLSIFANKSKERHQGHQGPILNIA